MSNVGLNLNLLAQMEQDLSPAQQFLADLNKLAQDIKSGNLPAVQQDYVTLSQDFANQDPSGSASAAEAGVIVSLLSDLFSLPIGPTDVPGQPIPLPGGSNSPGGFNYIDPLFAQRRMQQSSDSSTGPAAEDSAPSPVVRATPQPGASSVASPVGAVATSTPAHPIPNASQAVDSALGGDAASQRSSTQGPPISDPENQAATAELAGTSPAFANQLLPGLTPDNAGILPWTLFDWQFNSYRSQPIPAELLRKRKNPRGNAARTRTRRQKP